MRIPKSPKCGENLEFCFHVERSTENILNFAFARSVEHKKKIAFAFNRAFARSAEKILKFAFARSAGKKNRGALRKIESGSGLVGGGGQARRIGQTKSSGVYGGAGGCEAQARHLA